MQQLLFDCGYPPRPTMYSDEVTEIVLEQLTSDVVSWIEGFGPSDKRIKVSGEYYEEVKNDLRDAIEIDDDNFSIATTLRSSGWEVDSQLLNILDDVQHMRYDAFNKLLERWVIQNGVKSKFSIGQRVSFISSSRTLVEGVISKIDEKHAMYWIDSTTTPTKHCVKFEDTVE